MKWFSLLVVACLVGCSSETSQNRGSAPTEADARRALDAALTAWQQGEPPGSVANQSPRVQFVDSIRPPGQKLVGYEVLGEVPGEERRRSFLVQLRLENPAETPKLRFCVLGVDPLWVFREEELEMIGQWACGVEEDATKERAPSGSSAEAASMIKAGKENAAKENTLKEDTEEKKR
jgi:hypothetical protein